MYRVESVQSKTDIEPAATDNSVSFITLHTFSEKFQILLNGDITLTIMLILSVSNLNHVLTNFNKGGGCQFYCFFFKYRN